MEELVLALQKVLENLLIIHTKLVQIAEAMNEAIKLKNLEKIQELTANFDRFIGQIEELEKHRLSLCDSLTESLKSKKNHLNLQSIILMLPKNFQPSLSNIKHKLKQQLLSLHKINMSNQILLNDSLILIQKDFEIMTQFQSPLRGYSQTGVMSSGPLVNTMVNHIA